MEKKIKKLLKKIKVCKLFTLLIIFMWHFIVHFEATLYWSFSSVKRMQIPDQGDEIWKKTVDFFTNCCCHKRDFAITRQSRFMAFLSAPISCLSKAKQMYWNSDTAGTIITTLSQWTHHLMDNHHNLVTVDASSESSNLSKDLGTVQSCHSGRIVWKL